MQRATRVGCETTSKPGDRLSTPRTDDSRRLRLPIGILGGEIALEELGTPQGQSLAFDIDEAAGQIVEPYLPKLLGSDRANVYLEYLSAGKFRLVLEQSQGDWTDEALTTENGVPIGLAGSDDVEL